MQPARRGGRPELDRAGLGGDGERLARRHDVVPLVAALAARVAEVVGVLGGADDREDDRVARTAGGLGSTGSRADAGAAAPTAIVTARRVRRRLPLGLSSGGLTCAPVRVRRAGR